jgi:hypothetical protein
MKIAELVSITKYYTPATGPQKGITLANGTHYWINAEASPSVSTIVGTAETTIIGAGAVQYDLLTSDGTNLVMFIRASAAANQTGYWFNNNTMTLYTFSAFTIDAVYRVWATDSYVCALVKRNSDSHYYLIQEKISDGAERSLDLGTSPMIPSNFVRNSGDKIDMFFYITDGMYLKTYDISANTISTAATRYTTTNLAAHVDCLNGFTYNQNIGYLVCQGATAASTYKTIKFYLSYGDQVTLVSTTISDYQILFPNNWNEYGTDFDLGWETTTNRVMGCRNQGHLMIPLTELENVTLVGGGFIITSTAIYKLGNVAVLEDTALSQTYNLQVASDFTEVAQQHILLYDDNDYLVSIGMVVKVEYLNQFKTLNCKDLILTNLSMPYKVTTFTINIGFVFFAVMSQCQGLYIDQDKSSADPFDGITYSDGSTISLKQLGDIWTDQVGYMWSYNMGGGISLDETAPISITVTETTNWEIIRESVGKGQIGMIRLFGKGIISERNLVNNGNDVLLKNYYSISNQTTLDAIRDNLDEQGDVKTVEFATATPIYFGEEFTYTNAATQIAANGSSFISISCRYDPFSEKYIIIGKDKITVEKEDPKQDIYIVEDRVATLETGYRFVPIVATADDNMTAAAAGGAGTSTDEYNVLSVSSNTWVRIAGAMTRSVNGTMPTVPSNAKGIKLKIVVSTTVAGNYCEAWGKGQHKSRGLVAKAETATWMSFEGDIFWTSANSG